MSWVVYALLSALCAGCIPVLAKRGLEHVDPTLATAVRAFFMAAILMLAALLLGKFRHLGALDRPALLLILASGLAGAASWFFYFTALRQGPASGVAVLDRTSIVFTFALAALFLREPLNGRQLLGVGLIVAGALLTLKR